MTVKFTVLGEPRGKQRPRVTRKAIHTHRQRRFSMKTWSGWNTAGNAATTASQMMLRSI